ncbi:MAG: protein BatD [Epsilonproteobacteria bacterium]|nr:protein BatD [Campylobacterota bacterium]
MRKILGSLLIALSLFANGYKVEISKREAFVKEPLILDLKYFESNKDEIDWISFEPKRSDLYEFKVLKKGDIEGGYEFEYLLFPLKSGEIEVKFDLRLKRAPIEEIRSKTLGTGYEQTIPVEGKVYSIEVSPLLLKIKRVKKVDFYGNFKIDAKADRDRVLAYEPVYYSFSLKGVGYPPKIDEVLKDLKGVKILRDKPSKSIRYERRGAVVEYLFRYALVSDKNFTIPSLVFREFDYKDYKILKTKAFKIEVKEQKDLIDKKNSPKRIEPFYKDLLGFLKYLAVFLAGGISGVLLYIFFRNEEIERILKAKDERELLSYLVVRYPDSLSDIKESLDRAISKKESLNLRKIKREIIKRVRKMG